MNEKRCSKCSLVKPHDVFYRDGRTADGLRSACKVCLRAQFRAYQRAHKGEADARSRAWARANPERVAARDRAWNAAHPEKRDAVVQRWRLGLTHDQTAELRRRSCAICGLPPGSGRVAHCIDHDHTMTGPGSVRGTLCRRCNLSLGRHERGELYGRTKCPAWQASADAYLERHQIQLSASPDAGQ